MINICDRILWDDLDAVQLKAGAYEALIIPQLGANVIKLNYAGDGCNFEIIRTPENAKTLIDDPYAYGIPVLFPANRINGGKYTYDSITYQYPLNYPNNVHIHGVLHNSPWKIKSMFCDADTATCILTIRTYESDFLKSCIPIDITFELENVLSEKGLLQRFTVVNHSEHIFPFGLAYHTTFNVPFTADKDPDHIRLHLPIKGVYVDDGPDRIPSGEIKTLSVFEKGIADVNGAMPLLEVLDFLYSGEDKEKEAIFKDLKYGKDIVYRAGDDFGYWIIWNKTTKEGFVAVEPQTWLSNALCMGIDLYEKYGVIFVHPGKSWSGDTQIFVR
jgi:aldose 1-epimerase